MEKIEKIQYQAGLAITGAWQGSNRNKLYENLGWESLSGSRFIRSIPQPFKIRTNLTAAYLNENYLLYEHRGVEIVILKSIAK